MRYPQRPHHISDVMRPCDFLCAIPEWTGWTSLAISRWTVGSSLPCLCVCVKHGYIYIWICRYDQICTYGWFQLEFLLMNDFLGYSNFRKPLYIYIHVYIYILSCPELCGYPLLSQPSRRSVGWEWHWRCPGATRDILGHWCHRHLEWKDHGFFRMKPWCKSYR